MRGVERVWVLLRQEALRSGSSVALKDKEANALRNLARLTSLDINSIYVDYVPSFRRELLQRPQRRLFFGFRDSLPS